MVNHDWFRERDVSMLAVGKKVFVAPPSCLFFWGLKKTTHHQGFLFDVDVNSNKRIEYTKQNKTNKKRAWLRGGWVVSKRDRQTEREKKEGAGFWLSPIFTPSFLLPPSSFLLLPPRMDPICVSSLNLFLSFSLSLFLSNSWVWMDGCVLLCCALLFFFIFLLVPELTRTCLFWSSNSGNEFWKHGKTMQRGRGTIEYIAPPTRRERRGRRRREEGIDIITSLCVFCMYLFPHGRIGEEMEEETKEKREDISFSEKGKQVSWRNEWRITAKSTSKSRRKLNTSHNKKVGPMTHESCI